MYKMQLSHRFDSKDFQIYEKMWNDGSPRNGTIFSLVPKKDTT